MHYSAGIGEGKQDEKWKHPQQGSAVNLFNSINKKFFLHDIESVSGQWVNQPWKQWEIRPAGFTVYKSQQIACQGLVSSLWRNKIGDEKYHSDHDQVGKKPFFEHWNYGGKHHQTQSSQVEDVYPEQVIPCIY